MKITEPFGDPEVPTGIFSGIDLVLYHNSKSKNGDFMRVRFVLENSRTVEVKRYESKTRIILKEKTKEKKKEFSIKADTVVEMYENDGVVSIKFRPVRGKVKEETMSF